MTETKQRKFECGQRVVMNYHALKNRLNGTKDRRKGTIIFILATGYLRIRRDGVKQSETYSPDYWEPLSPAEAIADSGPETEEQPAASDRGFVSAPTASELKPTEREAFLLDTLWKWQETSAKSRIMLGHPLNDSAMKSNGCEPRSPRPRRSCRPALNSQTLALTEPWKPCNEA